MEVSAGDVFRSGASESPVSNTPTYSNILQHTHTHPSESLQSACCYPSVQDSPEKNCPADQVSVDRMDITKGFLDDISRPASGEIRRLSRDGPRSLQVLSPDVTHSEVQTDLTAENSSDQEESDEEIQDPELRKAIKKMKELDRILALKASAEREVKQRGKEQHQRLWQELQASALRTSSHELENTRRFLALTPNNFKGSSDQDCDEVDLVPVFETEVVDLMSDINSRLQTEAGQQVSEDQSSDSRQRGAARSKRRQDFVRRNIELAGASGNGFLLTPQEQERIEELLKDLEEDQNHSETEPQVLSSSPSVGEGFSPEPADLHSLHRIDSRLQLLIPVQDFLSVRSSSQMSVNTGDAERQRRDDERRLQEIQHQLQLLEDSEPGTVHLSDEDLRNLLLECEEDMIRSPAGSSSDSSLRMSSALNVSPCLSSSDLLQDVSAQ